MIFGKINIWGDTSMLHVHILSWGLTIVLFIATYLNFSKIQGASPYFNPLGNFILYSFLLLLKISQKCLTVFFLNFKLGFFCFSLL